MVAPNIDEGFWRTGINGGDIYFISGSQKDHEDSNLDILRIYDMKYHLQPTKRVKLLASFKPSSDSQGCFFQNSKKVICCNHDGSMFAYDLTDQNSIKETPFNKASVITHLQSCMITKDGQHIIAGAYANLYILDAEGENLQIYDYSYMIQELKFPIKEDGVVEKHNTDLIVEIRPYMFITVGNAAYSLHDFTDLGNPQSFNIFPKVVEYSHSTDFHSVIALNNNPGEFAVGGYKALSLAKYIGAIFILHLEEDNRTVTPIKYIDNLDENEFFCVIASIKEFKKGTIIFAGLCTIMCLWNYAAIPSQSPQCWDDQTPNVIDDILLVPY